MLRQTAALAAALALAMTFAATTLQRADAQMRGPQSVADLAEKLAPAVVNISTSQTVKGRQVGQLPRVPKGSPFEEFFEDFFADKGGRSKEDRKVSSLGSGFVIDGKEGLIVTNVHVIDGADEIVANFSDGTKLKVDKVVGRDSKTDLALLKVTPKKPLPAVKFGASEKARIGDWVMAIGNPFGLGGTVTVGIISAKARDINSGPYDDYLQTDAAINKGNSGGPLFNMDGDVIGINTAIISPTGGSIGIGFAVPSETAIGVVEQLKSFGETRRGWLGVNIATVSEEIAESVGVPENSGALVTGVTPGGPANKAGIENGDVIIRFDGKEITAMRGLPRVVAGTAVGKAVDVEIMRKGEKRVIKVMVGRLVEEAPAATEGANPKPADPTAVGRLIGLTLAPLTDEMRKKYGLKDTTKGLVVTEVEPQGPGAQRKIEVGDVIIEAADEAVATLDDVAQRVDKVRKSGRKQILLRLENAKGEFKSVALPFR
jgi:serine protease Do